MLKTIATWDAATRAAPCRSRTPSISSGGSWATVCVTCRALMTPASHPDVPAIARELSSRGIVVAPSERFLTDDGQRALGEAASRLLATGRNDNVEAVVSGRASAGERQKEFVVHLVSYRRGIPSDDPIRRSPLTRSCWRLCRPIWDSGRACIRWRRGSTIRPMRLRRSRSSGTATRRICGSSKPSSTSWMSMSTAARSHTPRYPPVRRRGSQRSKAREEEADCRRPDDAGVSAGIVARLHRRPEHDDSGRHARLSPRRQAAARPADPDHVHVPSGVPLTARSLSVDGMPAWISSDIQRWAVKPLLGRVPDCEITQSKKQKKSAARAPKAGEGHTPAAGR